MSRRKRRQRNLQFMPKGNDEMAFAECSWSRRVGFRLSELISWDITAGL